MKIKVKETKMINNSLLLREGEIIEVIPFYSPFIEEISGYELIKNGHDIMFVPSDLWELGEAI